MLFRPFMCFELLSNPDGSHCSLRYYIFLHFDASGSGMNYDLERAILWVLNSCKK